MFCPKCGKQSPDGSRFCAHCGALVTAPQPAPAVQRVQPQSAPKRKKEKEGGFNYLKLLLVGLMVALIVLILAVAWKILDSSDMFDSEGTRKKSKKEATNAGELGEADALLEGNPYAECFREYADYVLPESSSKYLGYADVSGLSEEEARIALLEMAARQGEQFTDPQVQAYFDARQWYNPGGSYAPSACETSNEKLLAVYLGMLDGSLYRQGNKYLEQFPEDQYYAVDGSDSRYMRAADLKALTAEQLVLARNEIYARKGCIFTSEELQTYFYTRPWYVPAIPVGEFDENDLNQYEKNNIKMVQLYEKRLEGVLFSEDNPYIVVYEQFQNTEYILPNSSDRELTEDDLWGYTAGELVIARNEIYARNGYTFSSENLQEYFLQKAWYFPDTPYGDSDAVSFSKIEKDNISLLKKREKELEDGGADATWDGQYVYLTGNCCFHIPVVELSGVNASEMNRKLYDTYYKVLQDEVFGMDEDELSLGNMIYTVGKKGDIVSVVVELASTWDYVDFDVYHFSASTGKELSDEEVFRAYGMSLEQGRSMIKQSMTAYWEDMEGSVWEDDEDEDAFFQEQKERTLADSNIREVRPMIAENGELQFVGRFYSIAGADEYFYRFDRYGNTIWNNCKEHS